MIADVFTKSLAREPFDLDVGRLGMTARVWMLSWAAMLRKIVRNPR